MSKGTVLNSFRSLFESVDTLKQVLGAESMPGNEYGERIHNFFGQEGLSQDQHQSQVVNGSWSTINNGLAGNQRQIDPSLITNLRSYSTQQSGYPERGQSSSSQHGLNFTQQPMRSDDSRTLLQDHQQLSNGYMHGQAMPSAANFLGLDVESNRDSLSAKGFSPDLQKVPMRFEMGESPVNYDFFGGQQHLNSQLPGMLQPFPRQQMTFNDMQLLKQQVMVKQMQQQLQKQHLETRQINSLNSDAVNGSRSGDNQSHSLINGIPVQDGSSACWQPDLTTGNANWMHRGISPVGLMINPEHGQTNLLQQQFEPSLYGMHAGWPNVPHNALPSVQMNRLAVHHGSENRSSSLSNQPTPFLNQGDVQQSHMIPKSTYQEKPLFSHTSVPGSNSRPSFESFQQDDSRGRNISVQEKYEKMEVVKVPENITTLQKSTTLDPTEEKILFGSDDNLWEAFGNSNDMSLTGNHMSSGSDLFDACPSLQSGSWSALMQSAVAETSSDDVGFGSRAQDLGVKATNALSERLHSDSTRLPDNGMLEKPMAKHSQMAGNIFHSSSSGIDGQINSRSIQRNESTEDRFGIWKAASNPNLAAPVEQKNYLTQNLQLQRESYGFGNADAGNNSSASRERSIQQPLDNNSMEKAIPQLNSREGSHILESYASNNAGKVVAEPNEMENPNDSFRLKFSQQSFTRGEKDNTQANACDLSMLPGGKETQPGHLSSRPSVSRKFQYHPMGNIGITDEPYREKVSHLPPTSQQISIGNQGPFGQSKSLGQAAMNMRIDRGHISQNNMNCTNEAVRGTGSENSPNAYASVDRSGDMSNQVKSASSRQTMLELLDKVDQSQEPSLETNVYGIPEAKTSAEYGGQFRQSQSSASQGFNLQLAPPSQPACSPDSVQFSRDSLQPMSSLHHDPEKGGTGQSRFARQSNQAFPQQSTYQGPFPGIPGGPNMTSGFAYSRGYHQNQLMPVTTQQSAANHLVSSSSELSTPQVKERDERSDVDRHGHSAQTPSLLNPTTYKDKGHSTEGFPMLSTASQPLVSSSTPQPGSTSGMMSDSRTVISAPQHRFWKQPSKPQPDILRPHPFPGNNVEGVFARQEKTNQISSQSGGDMSSNGRDATNMHELQSNSAVPKQISDVGSMFSKMVESNLETFGRSLPSTNLPKNNLRHDEPNAVNTVEESTAVMRAEEHMDVQRFENSAGDQQKEAPRGEKQPPSIPGGLSRDGLSSQNVSQNLSNKNHTGSDLQQISPHMAPSWYSQYGALRNGLLQPTPMKIGEQSSNVGSSADGIHSVQLSKQLNTADPGYTVHVQTISGSAPEVPTSESLPHGAADKLASVDKPKKRKTATSELVSYNKEVMQGPQRPTTLSEADVDWVKASNRFAEKVEFETSLEDVPPVKSKRRLIYTTQLMQHLFRPPPARVMSLVASSNYEFVVYTAGRAALGDACSSTSADRSDCLLPPLNNSNLSSERMKTEKPSDDQYIYKAAKDFISRTQKLETEFAGLESGTTTADLRVEVQDLERFAVINRFARFHPSSSSVDRTVSSLKLNPQRYVSIAPMPQNIPDRVQCLSL